MAVYFPNIINPNWCIGNSLSTINYNFTALDTNLSSLSTYTVNSVRYLSSTLQTVSATLQTEVNYLSTSIQNLSSTLQTEVNYLSTYNHQGTLFQLSNGQINWDMSVTGINAKVTLSANGKLNNPTGLLFSGQEGNLIIQQPASTGILLSAFGTQWAFHNYLSAMNLSANGRTKLHYYYDGSNLLSNLTFF